LHITNILCAFFIAQRRNLFFYEIFPLLTPFLAHLTHFNFSLDKGARLEIHNSKFKIQDLDSEFKIIPLLKTLSSDAHLRGLGRSPKGRAREGVSKSLILPNNFAF
jgi:hypothetical protein